MTPRHVIHVGYPKTGTTWLQKNYFKPHPGICFFERHKPDGEWLHDLIAIPGFRWEEEAFLRAAAPFRADPPAGRIHLASYEHLVGTPFTGSTEALMAEERIGRYFSGCRIMIGLREQSSLLWSLYQQYVMLGGSLGPEDFFNQRWPSVTRIDYAAFEFDKLVSRYQTRFGRENVFVYFQENLLNNRPAELARLSEWLGAGPFDHSGATPDGSNISLSRTPFFILRLLNHFLASDINPPHLLPRAICDTLRLRRFLQRRLDPFLRRIGMAPSPAAPRRLTDLWRGLYASSNLNVLRILGECPSNYLQQ